jgi:glycosyltransferase involved in cell wall biosynthesis
VPRYTIITPTILRGSLEKTCDSVNSQTCGDWEHIIVVDGPEQIIPYPINHHQRHFVWCDERHNDWGNTCRRNVWKNALGDYVYYLDDDNYLADDRVLEEFNTVTADWAIFPILKPHFGGMHFFCPPVVGGTDTGSFIVKREFAQWPETLPGTAAGADGRFAQKLKETHDYDILLTRPLMVYGGVVEYSAAKLKL